MSESRCVGVVPVTRADVEPVARTMARAFEHDPFHVWMFPDPETRQHKAYRNMTTLLRHAVRLGCAFTDEERAAGAIWVPPGFAPSLLDRLRLGLGILPLLGWRARQVIAADDVMASHHPSGPHYELSLIGTDPDARGQGRASTLIRHTLEGCDAGGHDAFLFTSLASNVALYASHGFELVAEVPLPHGGPTQLAMLRRARR